MVIARLNMAVNIKEGEENASMRTDKRVPNTRARFLYAQRIDPRLSKREEGSVEEKRTLLPSSIQEYGRCPGLGVLQFLFSVFPLKFSPFSLVSTNQMTSVAPCLAIT